MKRLIEKVLGVITVVVMIISFLGTLTIFGSSFEAINNIIPNIMMDPTNIDEMVTKYSTIAYVISMITTTILVIYCVVTLKRVGNINDKREEIFKKKLKYLYEKPRDFVEVREKDPGFSRDKLMIRVKKMYIRLDKAMANEDENALRLILTDRLLEKYLDILNERKSKNEMYALDSICIRLGMPYKFEIVDGKEKIYIQLQVERRAYIRNKTTGKIIGDKKVIKTVSGVELVLIRMEGAQTQKDSDHFDSENCPNCGAPLNISLKGICDYCGEIVMSDKFNWTIDSIKEEILDRNYFKGVGGYGG